MKLLIAILAAISSLAYTAPVECKNTSAQIGVLMTFGIQPGGRPVYYWYNFPDGTLNATIAYGGGLNVGNIDFLFSSKIGFGVEVTAIPFNADRVERSDGATAEYDGRGVPILLWSEISQPGKFGPFVKLGVGAVHVRFSKRYDPLPLLSHDFDYWSFAYGYGGGLRYLISRKIECLFVVEVFKGTDTDNSTNEYGHTSKSIAPFGLTFNGFRVRYWF